MRLFVAVWPPASAVSALRSAVSALRATSATAGGVGGRGDGLRWIAPDQWHVTLRFLGEADLDEATAAFRTLAGVGRGPAAVEVVLGPATASFGRRVLQVPVWGLAGVAEAVSVATASVGHPLDDRAFAGHVTLARARVRGGMDLSAWCGAPVAASWAVGELTLVASRPATGGPRYEVVDRLATR